MAARLAGKVRFDPWHAKSDVDYELDMAKADRSATEQREVDDGTMRAAENREGRQDLEIYAPRLSGPADDLGAIGCPQHIQSSTVVIDTDLVSLSQRQGEVLSDLPSTGWINSGCKGGCAAGIRRRVQKDLDQCRRAGSPALRSRRCCSARASEVIGVEGSRTMPRALRRRSRRGSGA